MAKANNISMKMISRDADKFKEVVNIDFEDVDPNTGEKKDYTITLFPYFDPLRIANILERLKVDLIEIDEQKEISDIPDKLLPVFVEYHAMLEFTNIPKPKSKKVDKRIAFFQEFIKTKYFKMIDEHIIQEEFNKVWDKLMEIMAANEKIERYQKKMQNEIQNLDLQSPELREKLQPNKKRIPEA